MAFFPRILQQANDVDDVPVTVGRVTIDDLVQNVRSANQRVETCIKDLNKAFNAAFEAKSILAQHVHEQGLGVTVVVEPHPDEPAYIHMRSADE